MKSPRYLSSFEHRETQEFVTDVLVIGSGIAGLVAAIEASRHCDVTLLTKASLTESNTRWAQGGIAVAWNDSEGFESHIADTLTAGDGLCDEDIVRMVVEEGPSHFQKLLDWGGQFDRHKNGRLALTREGGHSQRRIIHAQGDATGHEIERCLAEHILSIENIRVLDNVFVIDLITQGNTCYGAVAFDNSSRRKSLYWASATILASGGTGQIYRETTNPAVATGDGHAMAYRAGAVMRDMEFMQFHPTTLYIAGLGRKLISEAVRGEGALLRDRNGERFMVDIHPLAELAPRDVVSRAILERMVATNDTNAYLDLTHQNPKEVKKRFPGIVGVCEAFGIDVGKDWIPVSPGAHYMLGGVRVNRESETSVRRLYAAGEVTSSGLHGANRLASNSLLEGLVFGVRSGENAGKLAKRSSIKRIRLEDEKREESGGIRVPIDMNDMFNSIKSVMWRHAGIVRTEEGLAEAAEKIEFWGQYLFRHQSSGPVSWELSNMLIVSHLVIQSAMARQETRGVHCRERYPERDDTHWQRHVVVRNGVLRTEVNGSVRRKSKKKSRRKTAAKSKRR
ncbi:MAG: L-aspartate oxidase [Planctomycetota bacterium]